MTSRCKSIREQHDHCRHFTGIGSNADGSRRPLGSGRGTCSANVKYDDVMKQGKRMIALPCFHPETDNMPADGSEWPTCPHLSFKTPAELYAEAAQTEAWMNRAMERITIVRPAILKHAGWKQTDRDEDDEVPAGARRTMDGATLIAKECKDASGSFACPICTTGTLNYSIASYNGHVHAHCSTDGCVCFME